MAAQEYLVSVANAIIRDSATGNALVYGITNISSAFTLTTNKTEVRGGINNALLYEYIHDRNLEVNIEQAIFNETLLGLNVGQTASTASVTVTATDCIVLSGGSGNTLSTPNSTTVSVFLPDGTIDNVTPAGSAIYVGAGASQKVNAVYTTAQTASQITVESTTPPNVVDLTLVAEVRDNTNTIVDSLQINIPRFQVSGDYTLSMTANGVSSETLNGKALVNVSDDCDTEDYYAKCTWIPVDSTVLVSSIAAIPSTITFDDESLPDTAQITTLGIKGGIYQNVNITTDCTYARESGETEISVGGATGLVTAASSGSDGDSAIISSTYYQATAGSLIDYVTVNIT